MELLIPHPDFQENQLAFRRAGIIGRTGLFQNGKRLRSKLGKYQVTKDDGQAGVVELRSTWKDPIPVVIWDSQAIRLVRPFTWKEAAGSSLPMVLALFTGHYFMAFFCLLLMPTLADCFRNDGSGPTRYYVFGLKAGCILLLLIALAWLTYPRRHAWGPGHSPGEGVADSPAGP